VLHILLCDGFVPSPVRLFVALYPPPDLAASLVERAATLAAPAGLRDPRPVPAEKVHLTLLFLGERAVRELDPIRESVARSVAGLAPPRLRVPSIEPLPNLLAAVLEQHPTISQAHTRLAQRLARKPERRAFLPHLTLVRGRGAAEPSGFREPLDPMPEFQAAEVRLMESVLHPSGAEHRLLEAFPFCGT
jgi:RNA 2',3'-cyclic 3'-phosphodiesterase